MSTEKGNKKRFQKSWQDDPKFAAWLRPLPNDDFRASCIACHTSFLCGKTEILRHSMGSKHLINVISLKETPQIKKNLSQKIAIHGRTKVAEKKLSAFFAKHNVALEVVEHLLPLLKDVFPDSQILSNVTLERTKSSQIIKKVPEENELIGILRTTKFLILIDETTDEANVKYLRCLVRFLHPDSGKVVTKLLQMINISALDSGADALFDAFSKMIKAKGIPFKNIIGMASDNASDMKKDCKTAWKSLRDKFVKAAKEKNTKTGQELVFLKDSLKRRKTSCNNDSLNEESETIDLDVSTMLSVSSMPNPISSPSSSSQEYLKDDDCLKEIGIISEKKTANAASPQGEKDPFFITLDNMVNRAQLTPSETRQVQRKVFNFIADELDKLENNK